MKKTRKNEHMALLETEYFEAATPTRIDLAGGTVDIWPIYLFHNGAVTINAGINLFVRLRISISMDGFFHIVDLKKDRSCTATTIEAIKNEKGFELFGWALQHFMPGVGLEIVYNTMAPEGAGLAGSSSLLVALCGILNRITQKNYSRTRMLQILRDIETQCLRVPAGLQDYYPALWGGINSIRWNVGGGKKEPIDLSIQDLEQWLMLVYTKTSRCSGANNWNILKRHIERDKRIQRLLQKIVFMTNMMHDALINGDFQKAGEAMGEEALYRKQLLPSIVTQEIRHLEKIVKSCGVIASKVCGAGGGGCVLLFVEPQRRDAVQRRVIQEGYEILNFRIARAGLSLHKGLLTDPI